MLSDVVRFSAPQQLRRAGLAVLSLAVLSCLLLVTSTASATKSGSRATLDDLVNGDAIILSSGGGLRFSNFQVEITGGNADLSKYKIQGRFNGFKLYGAKPRVEDEALNIRLSYDVETVRSDHAMTAVGLSSHKWNKYGGNVAFIEVLNQAAEEIASGTRIEDRKKFDRIYYDFSEFAQFASVNEEIRIDKSGKKKWKLKRRFLVNNDYIPAPIPEPNTALMLGLGMAGFATYSRRRR